jgi:hypothetical protein
VGQLFVFKEQASCLKGAGLGEDFSVFEGIDLESGFDDVGSLQAFGAFHDIKLYGFAFLKGFEAVLLNGRKMHEHIISVFTFDETEAFFFVEPFYFALHD